MAKGFTDLVLRLKAFSKFLGYLHFSPNWNTGENNVEECSALAAGLEHSISIADRVPPPFDVESHIAQAIESHHLILSIPWIVDYLRMIAGDRIRSMSILLQNLWKMVRWYTKFQFIYNNFPHKTTL